MFVLALISGFWLAKAATLGSSVSRYGLYDKDGADQQKTNFFVSIAGKSMRED